MVINKERNMKERNTRQKDIITDVIKKTKIHPTAKELYQMVKTIDSSIGQATVYRQLHRLLEEGKINCVTTIDNEEHYDWKTSFHAHFICNHCHRIFDIMLDEGVQTKLFYRSPHQILSSNIVACGICKECLKEDINEISL